MKIKQGKPFVILSSDNINSLASRLIALGFKFKYVHGCYNGMEEVSLLVPIKDRDMYTLSDLHTLRIAAGQHKQESILFVDHNRDTTLINVINGNQSELGKFVRVYQWEAVDYDNWTQDTKTGQYWTTKLAA